MNPPAAAPAGYVDIEFAADPTQTYKLWVRLQAERNYWGNDSVWLQFSGAVGASGQPAYRIGGDGLGPWNLEECSGCGVAGWGWEDDGWGRGERQRDHAAIPSGRTAEDPNSSAGGRRVGRSDRALGRHVSDGQAGRAKNDNTILPRVWY